MNERKHRYSTRYKVIEVDGHQIMIYVVDDLDDELLQEHFKMALDKEDFEYFEAIRAEAMHRNLRLKVK